MYYSTYQWNLVHSNLLHKYISLISGLLEYLRKYLALTCSISDAIGDRKCEAMRMCKSLALGSTGVLQRQKQIIATMFD